MQVISICAECIHCLPNLTLLLLIGRIRDTTLLEPCHIATVLCYCHLIGVGCEGPERSILGRRLVLLCLDSETLLWRFDSHWFVLLCGILAMILLPMIFYFIITASTACISTLRAVELASWKQVVPLGLLLVHEEFLVGGVIVLPIRYWLLLNAQFFRNYATTRSMIVYSWTCYSTFRLRSYLNVTQFLCTRILLSSTIGLCILHRRGTLTVRSVVLRWCLSLIFEGHLN